MGGEIYYDYLGGNTYKLYMKVYRDCINGSPFAPFEGFPDPNGNITPAVYTVFDASGSVVMTGIFTPLSSTAVPPTNNSPCAPASSGNACVEEAKYEATVTLPPVLGGYYIAYQRCCRNGTILNLINPGAVGATYWEHIPGPEVAAVNSSPRFTNRPPIYICSGIPIAFDHVATDPDGDSLVYSLCDPFDGLGSACPVVSPTGCQTVNDAPPYFSVPFLPPYNSAYPMSSSPAVNIHQGNGFLSGVPNMQGQWVMGVCVEEYRNGQLIGTHHRDFQFNVIACPYVVSADIISQTTTNNGQGTGYCNGFTISYSNNSYNGTTYHWDFGDPNTLDDTSNVYNPNYTFTTPGIYTVTLIVNPGSPCGDTTTEVFHVYPLLSPDYITPSAQCFKGNNFNFSASGSYQGNGSFIWNFGSNATPQTANASSVSNVTFNAPGHYPVTLTVSENSCTATSTKTIEVFQSPQAAIGGFITGGCMPLTVTFTNQSTAATGMTYIWDFSDGTTSTAQNPVKTFTAAGIYTVSLSAITNQQCIDTSKVTAVNTITVAGIPTSLFNISSATGQCFDNNSFNFTNQSTAGTTANYNWNFGGSASPAQSSTYNVSNVHYNNSGNYVVTLTVNDAGCAHTSTQTVVLYPNPTAIIDTYPAEGCTPFSINFQNNSAGNNLAYLWNFSDGTSYTTQNITKTFGAEGLYNFTLSVNATSGCLGTSTLSSVNSITVTQTPDAQFSPISATGMCFKNNMFNFLNTGNLPSDVKHSWSFTPGASITNSASYNVYGVTFASAGTYTVTLTETKNNCIDKDVKLVELYDNPVADIGAYITSGCDPLTVTFANQSTAASNINYLWTFSDGTTSTAPNPTHVFTPYGTYGLNLVITTNTKCVDTSKISAIHPIIVYPTPVAGFNIVSDNETYVNCIDASSNDVVKWEYDFGDGSHPSGDQNTTYAYTTADIFDIVQTVTNQYGCPATYTQSVLFVPEFAFWIPNAFTPGLNDGLNDIFKPKVFGVEDYTFMIFNRWGEMIYKTHDINEGWDGTYKSKASPQDVYTWKCEFRNKVSQMNESHVGHVTLVR